MACFASGKKIQVFFWLFNFSGYMYETTLWFLGHTWPTLPDWLVPLQWLFLFLQDPIGWPVTVTGDNIVPGTFFFCLRKFSIWHWKNLCFLTWHRNFQSSCLTLVFIFPSLFDCSFWYCCQRNQWAVDTRVAMQNSLCPDQIGIAQHVVPRKGCVVRALVVTAVWSYTSSNFARCNLKWYCVAFPFWALL